jgi:predicted Zn finger-like uncharacterized protein
MYARCTHCQTIFRVSEAQLKIADGYVRCGMCQQPFNALETLQDQDHDPSQDPSQATSNVSTQSVSRAPSAHPSPSAQVENEAASLDAPPSPPENADSSDQILTDWFIDILSPSSDKESAEHTCSKPGTPQEYDSDVGEIRMHVLKVLGGLDLIWKESTGEAAEKPAQPTPSVSPTHAPSKPAVKSDEGITESAQTDEISDATAKERALTALNDDGFVEEPESASLASTSSPPSQSSDTNRDAASSSDSASKEKQLSEEAASLEMIPKDIPTLFSTASEEELFKSLQAHRSKPRRPGHARRVAIWSLACVSQLVLLGLLLLFAGRERFVHIPVLRPALEWSCSVTGCALDPRRALQHIVILNRTVAAHPERTDALQVTAQLQNNALFKQPLPLVELSLLDLNGNILGKRQFTPSEYLAENQFIPEWMAPRQAIYLKLDIQTPGQEVANFRFRFL